MRTFKRFLILLAAANCVIFTSCKCNEKTYNYEDFENYKIEWKNVFLPAKSHYFIYIYSETCGHCEQIKNDVLRRIDKGKQDIYLIEFSNDIPTSEDIEKTIGCHDVNELFILGTPTMIEIEDKIVINNAAGTTAVLALLN